MALHLVKLCVGIGSVEELADWQRGRLQSLQRSGAPQRLFHSTFQTPKRQAEVLDGGSLYWVIKGAVQARQRIIGFEDGHKPDGSNCCLILLDPELVAVRPVPRRAFQGWRYLDSADAPADLGRAGKDAAAMPPQMRRELAELGLL